MALAQDQSRQHVGHIDDFELDSFRLVNIDGREVGVVRTDRGFFAVMNRCPHQGAAVCAGRIMGTMTPSAPRTYQYSDDVLVLVCPWHRWEFELDTGLPYGVRARGRLLTYEVEVEDGEVFVKSRRGRRSEAA